MSNQRLEFYSKICLICTTKFPQNKLNKFLAVAEELAIKGLSNDTKPSEALGNKKYLATKRRFLGSSGTPQGAKKFKLPAPGEELTEHINIKTEPLGAEDNGNETSFGDESYGKGVKNLADNLIHKFTCFLMTDFFFFF